VFSKYAVTVQELGRLFCMTLGARVSWMGHHSSGIVAQDTRPVNLFMSFPDVYNKLDDDERRACVLGDNILGIYDCLVAGTSLVIQGDGEALAVPLPNIYRAWN
jgi:hypothetical protein